MIEDYLNGPERHRNVENPGESSSDGGGYRFLFYGSPKEQEEKNKRKKLLKQGASVKLDLSDSDLGDDIIEVHNDKAVQEKVEELGDKIKEIESDSIEDDQGDGQ